MLGKGAIDTLPALMNKMFWKLQVIRLHVTGVSTMAIRRIWQKVDQCPAILPRQLRLCFRKWTGTFIFGPADVCVLALSKFER